MARLQSRQISQLHQYQVLHAVRLAPAPLSRAEIAEATGLSQPAVSALTRRLLDSGALREAGARPSSGIGRREHELEIDPDFAWVIGVKLSMDHFTITVTDFAGTVRSSSDLHWKTPLAQAALVREVGAGVQACLDANPSLSRSRLAGVGVAVPGFVDSTLGEVLWSPVLKPARTSAALASALADRLGVEVFVENDANMLALAEQWYGRSGRALDVALVTLEHGLGLGLVVNGELYRGHSGLAAELGHIQIALDGRACRCGKSGCLEAYVAHYAVVEEGRQAGLLPAADDAPSDEAAYFHLAELAHAGNAPARAIFERQGRLLGQWIGNVVNLMSPQLVILDGGPRLVSDLFEPGLRAAMEQAMAIPHRGLVPLVLDHQNDEAWARGAASLVLQRVDETAQIVRSAARHGFDGENTGRRPGD
ncbi:MAG TPA: ROK family transcriptional regulator [Albitalea sp.]|nr:ROK family transcriptional regulator [Albitalea sp.]